MAPSLVKLSHAFNHHKHEVCLGKTDTHFHQSDFECNFYKFKLTSAFYVGMPDYTLSHTTIEVKQDLIYKTANLNCHPLTAFLRGPPDLV